MSALRLFAWNIRQGGGKRLGAIVETCVRHDADVLVISEYRGGESGERLRAALAKVMSPEESGSSPKPTCSINGIRKGSAPRPMRNKNPPIVVIA